LPSYFLSQSQVNFDEIKSELLFWESDLSHPASLKNEIKEWYQRWKSTPVGNIPTSLLDTLKQCDSDVYPCIHQLLIIGCTLPVTSCEAECSFFSVDSL
jgi:hypothetical protein